MAQISNQLEVLVQIHGQNTLHISNSGQIDAPKAQNLDDDQITEANIENVVVTPPKEMNSTSNRALEIKKKQVVVVDQPENYP